MQTKIDAVKATSSRILTFDLLRGYFLVAIILDHLAYYPSGLDWVSGRGHLYASAAEGFFLISGIVLGIVRGQKLVSKPFAVCAKLLLKRSVQLYLTAVILMFIFTFIGWQFLGDPGLKPGIRSPEESIWQIIWGGLNFQYIYGWADYLRLYAIFIFFSPLAMWLLRRGWWHVMLAISVLVWTQFNNSPLATAELSQVFSWQLIFFGGLAIGFHWNKIQAWWAQLSLRLRRGIVTSVVSVAAVTLLTNILIVYGHDMFGVTLFKELDAAIAPYFSKEQLPVTRLALFAVWFGAGFWFFWHFEQAIVRWLGWILLLFGTNSLYIYTLHAFVVFFAHLITTETASWILNLGLSLAAVMLIWQAARRQFLMKVIPR